MQHFLKDYHGQDEKKTAHDPQGLDESIRVDQQDRLKNMDRGERVKSLTGFNKNTKINRRQNPWKT